ncbi:hypothetical protein CPB84DRAFT_1788629 [Gymnopilus junonius]|uniref:F-box domain-containing protein n=1 Tax=Gymnopilus junonius TaxID=109634 RepID=A0A9P5NHE0_GYMJU|nr:hypothetical protein CPB84DRAFT_1788629 [Gymnopilus junonius]
MATSAPDPEHRFPSSEEGTNPGNCLPSDAHNDSVVESDNGSHISVFPADVLLSVFFLLEPATVDEPGDTFKSRTFRRTIIKDPTRAVSQVCRHWRTVAINAPLLWKRLLDWNTVPEEWFKVLLERTASLDLDFSLDYATVYNWTMDTSLAMKNIRTSSRHTDRITSIEIFTFSQDMRRGITWLLSYFPAGLPRLERISFRFHIGSKTYFLGIDTRGSGFVDLSPEGLRMLPIDRIPESSSPHYHNVRVLSATDLPQPAPHVSKWLSILRLMPNLSELTIKGSLGTDGAMDLPNGAVYLPKLTTLSLAGYIGERAGIETILDKIITNAGCNLYFAGRLRWTDIFVNSSDKFSKFIRGFKNWSDRWKPEDYKSTELHSCLDAKRFIMHNQSGEGPWPGLYFRVSIGWGNHHRSPLTDEQSTCRATGGSYFKQDTLTSILLQLISSHNDEVDTFLPTLQKIIVVNLHQVQTLDYSEFLQLRDQPQTWFEIIVDAWNYVKLHGSNSTSSI